MERGSHPLRCSHDQLLLAGDLLVAQKYQVAGATMGANNEPVERYPPVPNQVSITPLCQHKFRFAVVKSLVQSQQLHNEVIVKSAIWQCSSSACCEPLF
jgi:hypothetical protein